MTTHPCLPSRNEDYGFFRTLTVCPQRDRRSAEVWMLASRLIAEVIGASSEDEMIGIRDFLDSRIGRHFADDGWEQQCGFEQICNWQWVDVEGYEAYESARVEAREHSQSYTLGTLPSGTSPDFLLVLITATRTRAGAQGDYGSFVSAIPSGETICANGSTLLETAFQPNGEPWLSRILSVFLEGDSVRAEFKHSNRQYTGEQRHYASSCWSYPGNFAPLDDTRSDWTVSFEVYAGKFTT